jgi:hypothetical protein
MAHFAAELVATPADQNVDWSPAAVRAWRVPAPTACTQTAAVARDWADDGSVRALSDGPGMACEWSADRHAWQVLVEVVDAPGQPELGDYAVFQVGTPGLWCCAVSSSTWCC